MKNKITILLFCAFLIAFHNYAQRVVKKYQLPKGIKTTDYETRTIVFKVKKGNTFSPTSRNSNPALAKSFQRIGANEIKSRFGVLKQDAHSSRKCEEKNIDLSRIYELKIAPGQNLEEAINFLIASGEVEYAEPKFLSYPAFQPNDPGSDSVSGFTWHLNKIKAYEAWNNIANRGDSNLVIGIVDMGDNRTNIDLVQNVYINPGEDGLDGNNNSKRTNGIDDDGNGYKDDYQGWDFGNNDNNPAANLGGKQHGVMVAGMACARANNDTLMAGSGYNCKYMGIKVAADGQGSLAYGYEGMKYAVDNGCKVVNLSWGNYFPSNAEQELINWAVFAKDVLIIASGGNDNDGAGAAFKFFYPASYDNVLSIGYTDNSDIRQVGNYNKKIDLVAPGYGIASLNYNSTTIGWGSSFASPLTAGVAGALRAKYPSLSALQIGEIIRVTTDVIDTIPSNAAYIGNLGSGRLNMLKAMDGIANNKSVRYETWSASINSNKVLSLSFDFRNYLASISNLSIKASIVNGKGIGLDTTFVKASLTSNEAFNNNSTPFTFQLDNSYITSDSIFVKLSYSADGGNISDEYLYFIFPISKITLNTNLVTYSLYSGGLINNENNTGGWEYNSNPFLYEGGLMVASSPTKVSSMTRGENGYKTDFKSLTNLLSVEDNRFDTLLSNIITDVDNSNKVGVEIKQRTYFWKNAVLSKSFILECRVKNVSGNTIDSLGVGYFLDEDVYDYAANRADYDDSRNLAYVYYPQFPDLYGGVRLLTNQKVNYYAFDQGAGAIDNNIDTYNGFSDANKFKALTSGVARPQAGVNGNGIDIAYTYGATLYNLKNNEERIVAFAFTVGDGLVDLQAASDSVYNQFKIKYTSPTPTINSISVCKNDSVTIVPTNNGVINNFYHTSKNNSNLIADSIGMIKVKMGINDSSFVVTNSDSLFESNPLNFIVTTVKLNPDFSTIEDLNTQGKINFVSTANNANNWNWNFGDSHIATNATSNESNIYSSQGYYDVKLIVSNVNLCKDSIIKSIYVSNFLTTISLLNEDSTLNVSPNPAQNYVILRSNDSITSIQIVDIQGKIVLTSNTNAKQIKVDTSNFPNGVYHLLIGKNNQQFANKLVINK